GLAGLGLVLFGEGANDRRNPSRDRRSDTANYPGPSGTVSGEGLHDRDARCGTSEGGVTSGRQTRVALMGKLLDTVQRLVADEKYLVGQHASERLEERGIMEWQAVAALEDGELIAERPRSKPNPSVEVRESLPDGTEFKAVWSLLRQSGVAKLVTVHFFDRG